MPPENGSFCYNSRIDPCSLDTGVVRVIGPLTIFVEDRASYEPPQLPSTPDHRVLTSTGVILTLLNCLV